MANDHVFRQYAHSHIAAYIKGSYAMRLVTVQEMRTWRLRLRMKQAAMASYMGMALASYSDLERGKATVNQRHHFAFERATLTVAVERENPDLVWPTLRDDIMIISGLTMARYLPHMSNVPLIRSEERVATDCGAIECVNRCDGGHGADYTKCPYHRLTTQR